MKILIADPVHLAFIEILKQNNFTIVEGKDWTEEKILAEVNSFDGILVKSRFNVNKEFIDQAVNLKFIARNGVGLEHIDCEYCERKKIKIITAPEGSRDAVGEHALGMLLSLLHKINIADQQVRQGQWIREANRGVELKGKTVGIIGYGNMGSAFAKKLQGFDVITLAYDKYITGFGNEYVNEVQPEEIFAETDILSLHIPLTDETYHLINKEYINKFLKNIYLINTSRGKIIKTSDLAEALKTGKIKGACLDVLEYEKQSFENLFEEEKPNPDLQYLLNSDKLIFTPHIAGWTYESDEQIGRVLAEKVISIGSWQ
jgi:D-3-phosphoglycerate dehydrogenase / 2-oxoglutarate reductase